MQLKRFVAKDNHSVMKMVRDALGSEAIIVSNRAVSEGVEILASSGLDDSMLTESTQVESQSVRETNNTPSNNFTVNDYQSKNSSFRDVYKETNDSSEMNIMRAELDKLRSMLDAEISATKVGSWGQQSKARAELFDKLSRIGLSVDLVTQLIAATDVNDDLKEASRKVLVRLKDSINISKYDPIETGGVVVLHGPTGAGKTTTIAKLAARFIASNKPQDIMLVCADNTRIGAQEQMETFGKLLGISVVRLRENDDLDSLLGLLGDKKLVLVDSAGFGQSELRQMNQLTAINANINSIHHYLVISATMQRAAMARIFESFGNEKFEGMILTKLDDAIHLGDVLTCLSQSSMPLAYWTDGQNIITDIHAADAAILVTKAMHLSRSESENKDDKILVSILQNNVQQQTNIWG